MLAEYLGMLPQHCAEGRRTIRLGNDVVTQLSQVHLRLATQMGDETGDVSSLSSRHIHRSRRV